MEKINFEDIRVPSLKAIRKEFAGTSVQAVVTPISRQGKVFPGSNVPLSPMPQREYGILWIDEGGPPEPQRLRHAPTVTTKVENTHLVLDGMQGGGQRTFARDTAVLTAITMVGPNHKVAAEGTGSKTGQTVLFSGIRKKTP